MRRLITLRAWRPTRVRATDKSGVGDFFTKLIKPLRIQIDAQAQDRTDNRDAITPSHEYQATLDLVSEIEILREAMGIFDYPAEAEPRKTARRFTPTPSHWR